MCGCVCERENERVREGGRLDDNFCEGGWDLKEDFENNNNKCALGAQVLGFLARAGVGVGACVCMTASSHLFISPRVVLSRNGTYPQIKVFSHSLNNIRSQPFKLPYLQSWHVGIFLFQIVLPLNAVCLFRLALRGETINLIE